MRNSVGPYYISDKGKNIPSGFAPQLSPKIVYEEDNEDEEDIGEDDEYTQDGEDD